MAHSFLCFHWFWCFIHPFYGLKMCFVFFPPVCLLLYSSWWGSDSRWPVVLLHRLLSLWMWEVTARSCYRSEHGTDTQPYMTATTNIQRRDSGTFVFVAHFSGAFHLFLFVSDMNLKIEGKELIEQGCQQADAWKWQTWPFFSLQLIFLNAATNSTQK